jgi:uncharacterized OsmC-like protein
VSFTVETVTVEGRPTAIGSAGPYTLVIDRPEADGGGGLGFNGGQLLLLSIAGCVSNDLFREAKAAGISLDRVIVRVTGDFIGSPATSTPISYDVEIHADAPDERLRELVAYVDEIAEIPNSVRIGTPVRLNATTIR